MAIIEQLLNYPDMLIEVCGSWIWVSGNTKEHKDILKALNSSIPQIRASGIKPLKDTISRIESLTIWRKSA